MTPRTRRRILSLTLAAAGALSATARAQPLKYPAADRDEVSADYHGTRVEDPYRWLEHLDGARTGEWLKAQERITSEYVAGVPGREAIRRRLTALWDYERTGVPWQEGGRLFYTSNSGLQPQSVLYMQKDLASPPRVALDPNAISPDGSIAVRDYAVSPDGRFLAYNTARGGGDVADVHVLRLSDGRDLD